MKTIFCNTKRPNIIEFQETFGCLLNNNSNSKVEGNSDGFN